MRIGLLGGSFNPPHEGHALVTRIALTRLGLDRVWWLVTPGNPLKSQADLAALAGARRRRPAASSAVPASPSPTSRRISARATPTTRSPGSRGARQASGSSGSWARTTSGSSISGATGAPSPTSSRSPSSTGRARRSGRCRAGPRSRSRPWRVPEAEAARFADLTPPAFLFLHGPRSELSSTLLRTGG